MMPAWKDWNRFFAKVHIPEDPKGCWDWRGARGYGQRDGYGTFYFGLPKVFGKAHRYSYQIFKGGIPSNLELDHLCRNRLCVNPDHLEAVTQKENALRGYGVGALKARNTHCPQGHHFNAENVRITVDGARRCKPCERSAGARYRKRLRDKALQE